MCDATIGSSRVMDEKTRDQFVREVEEAGRISLSRIEPVEAVCKRLGVQAEYHPGTNKSSVDDSPRASNAVAFDRRLPFSRRRAHINTP